MNCREAERILLRSWDRPLDETERAELDRHAADCPRCGALAGEYAALRDGLHGLPQGTPRPFLAQRVLARIEALENPAPAAVWRKWCLRAIPVSLFLIGLFIGGLLFLPAGADGLSQSEALLLRNAQPVPETSVSLEEAKGLDRNMAIIFAASDRTPDRRPRP
jgi:anti-sigma factor RsiW